MSDEVTLATVAGSGSEVVLATASVGGGDEVVFTTKTGISGIDLSSLMTSEHLLSVGGTADLLIDVRNTRDNGVSITVDFLEDGSQIDTATATVQSGETHEFATSVSKSTTGTRAYQARVTVTDTGDVILSNTLDLTWMNVDPGVLTATPEIAAVGDASTLSIPVENTSGASVTVTVTFNEEGSALTSETESIFDLSQKTFATDVTKTAPSAFIYRADVTEDATGLTGASNPVVVEWDDSAATGTIIDDFERGDLDPYTGHTGNFTIEAGGIQGEFYLESHSNNRSITSSSGLPYYPSRADIFEWFMYISGEWTGAELGFAESGTGSNAAGYVASIRNYPETNISLDLDGGTRPGTQQESLGSFGGQWLRCRVVFGDPTITYTVFSKGADGSYSNEEASVSLDNTEYDSGNVSWDTSQSDAAGGGNWTQRWDFARKVDEL